MKATDLMVGDWVYNKHHKENIQIKPYDFFVHGHGNNGAFVVSSTIVSGRDFEPIPLTEEILMKNGLNWDIIAKFNAALMAYICGEIKCDNDWRTPRIQYVHQLQHLLRLAGVQKEIEL